MNLRDTLRQLGITFVEGGSHSHVTVGWLGLDCLSCSPNTRKFKLGVNVRSLATTCWSCGSQSLVRVLADAANVTTAAVRALLGDVAAELAPESEPCGKYTPPPGVGPLQSAHERYLESRGYDPAAIVKQWAVAGIGAGGRYQWRLFVPIAQDGVPVAWTTRAIGDVPHAARYRGAGRAESKVPRGDVLYGEDYVRHGVIVTEGPFDAWRIGPGAVCTCGTGFSRAQVLRLSRYPVRAVCFDNDTQAQKRAQKLAAELAIFDGCTSVVQLSGADPASSPPDEIEELRRTFLE